jgi:hypothetical protein
MTATRFFVRDAKIRSGEISSEAAPVSTCSTDAFPTVVHPSPAHLAASDGNLEGIETYDGLAKACFRLGDTYPLLPSRSVFV